MEVASQSEVKMLQNNNIFVLHFPVQSSKIKNIMTLVSHFRCQVVCLFFILVPKGKYIFDHVSYKILQQKYIPLVLQNVPSEIV